MDFLQTKKNRIVSIVMIDRLSFGFHNPNHAAALVCALLPLCLGWRRATWVGRTLSAALFAAVLLTQSRTGLIVAALEGAAWWVMRRGRCGFQVSDLRSRMGFRGQGAVSRSRPLARLGKLAVVALAVVLSLWRLGPRLALDGSILNRPKIWLAGMRLFAANPDGVGLGNSGALASAFLLPGDVPEVRTLVSSHLTLLAECGWLVGWAYLAFLALALCGVRRSPRVGLAFAGLVLSACASTVFDWPVLFGCAAQGGLGGTNLALSWLTLALFAAFGVWLIMRPTAFNACAEETQGVSEGRSQRDSERSELPARAREETEAGRHGGATTDSHGLARIEGKRPAVLNTEGFEGRRHGECGKTLDRIDRIVGVNTSCHLNPVNPVNPVRKTSCLQFSVPSVLNAVGMPVLFARAFFAAVASGAPCARWGEDDTRRLAPREAIDPEYLNPLYDDRLADLWRRDAP